MRNIIVTSIYLCFTILFACKKDDDQQHPPPAAKDCQIISQSGFIVADNEYGVGFRTKYSPDGRVEKVIAAILGHYSCVDTVRYNFTYMDEKNIHVTRASKNTCSEVPISIEDITASDSFDITLNAKGYLEKVMEYNVFVVIDDSTFPSVLHFNYDEKSRLESLLYEGDNSGYRFEYDEKENLSKISYTGDTLSFDVHYSYDYSREANNQLYITTGTAHSQYYNLAQILGWLPFQHRNICTAEWLYRSGGSFQEEFTISNHVVDNDNNLVSFDIMSSFLGGTQTITNTLVCSN